MKLEGIVEDIIYRNEANGYSVILVDVNGVPETVVGTFPILSEGESVCFEGDYQNNAKYGKQFTARSVGVVAPHTIEGIVRFLASGIIPGVGEVTAQRMADAFGEQTLDVIEHDTDKLASVKGISKRKADEIREGYLAVSGMRSAVIFLQDCGLGMALAIRVYERFGARTEQMVRTNPYRLVEEIDGIGFLTADRLAQKLGIGRDSDYRIRAGMVHLLKNAADQNGHTYVPISELTSELCGLLGLDVSEEKLTDLAAVMTVDGVVKISAAGDGVRVLMLSTLYRTEKGTADKLLRLLAAADNGGINTDTAIKNYESRYGVVFHEKQREAIALALTQGVCVITGGPGTGKTTIIKCVLQVLKEEGHTVRLLAPTGRAAKRMTEATGCDASTLHRALQAEGEGGRFTKNETNPIEATAVIVDEVSMVDVYLMHALLRALRPGTRLLLVGDRDQLPSVGAGNVLGDILSSGAVPSVALTQIYRQALESRIVTNAHFINQGKMPVTDNGANSDFFFLVRDSGEAIAQTVVEMVAHRLPKFLGEDSCKIQVLSPIKAGAAGVNRLNTLLQNALNPMRGQCPVFRFGETEYRIGDRVMHTVNDYDLAWTRTDGSALGTEGKGVFNGDIGTVVEISAAGELDVVFEDGRCAKYGADKLGELMLSYAITVHKSQGCEFDAVVMPILTGSPSMLTRNLLYTGITRAKRLVVLIGSRYALERMVQNDYTALRYSKLAELLKAGNNFLGGGATDAQ